VLRIVAGIEPANSQAAKISAALVDVGSWAGGGSRQDLRGSDECESLVLWSAQPLATRNQGKHQPLAATILAEANRLSGYTQSQLDKIALHIIQRSRKTLGYEIPASKLRASVTRARTPGNNDRRYARFVRQSANNLVLGKQLIDIFG
jgi:hypothetical protein